MNRTDIEWTRGPNGEQGHTWSPIVGCEGPNGQPCPYCYARRLARRRMGEYGEQPKGEEFKPRFLPERLEEPLKLKKPSRIFVCSMADMFSPSIRTPVQDKILYNMTRAYWHTFVILTKRPDLMYEWAKGVAHYPKGNATQRPISGLPPNVWLGVSVEDQVAADERIPWLVKTPAAVRLVSVEPMQGPLDFSQWLEPTPFDYFATTCIYACSGIVNNGYCCSHPNQEMQEDGEGYCYSMSCPLGREMLPSDPDDVKGAKTFGIEIDCNYIIPYQQPINWLILGAETGNRKGKVAPKREWIDNLVSQCQAAGVAVFEKRSLAGVVDRSLIQQYPEVQR